MTSFYDSYDHYKKMVELQAKLRKSEEERIRLEERFKILAQESRNRHDACINRLRLRYIEFLEEQRIKDERNHKLFEALDRVDNSLTLMTVKSDRLNVLRKQYEAYVYRTHKAPNLLSNVIDDSHIPKQQEGAHFRRGAIVEQIPLSTETRNVASQEMFRLNDERNRSMLSSSVTKFAKSAPSGYFDHREADFATLNMFNQQPNNYQNTLPICSPSVSQSTNPEMLTRSSSFQIFQQEQPHVSHVSSGQVRSLSQPTSTHRVNTMLEQMDIAQTASQIPIPEQSNDTVSRQKFLDISRNRFTPMAPQHYAQLSPAMQPYQEENRKVSLDSTGRQIRNMNEMPSGNTTILTTPERNVYGTNLSGKPLNLTRRTGPSYWSYPSRKPAYLRTLADQSPVRLSTTSDVDTMMRKHTRFPTKLLDSPRFSMYTGQSAVEKDDHVPTIVVENELDMYMNKIRKLRRDLDAQNLEEVNDDEKKAIATNNQAKRILPENVEKVLALADDLASRTADLIVANDSGKTRPDKNRNVGIVLTAESNSPITEGNSVAFSNMHEGRKMSVPLAEDKISNDIQLREPKLDSHQNIEQPWKENHSDQSNSLESREKQLHETQVDGNADRIVSSDNRNMEENSRATRAPTTLRLENVNTYVAQESRLKSSIDDNLFDTVEELQPWNLDVLQRRIKEIELAVDTRKEIDGEVNKHVSELNQDEVEGNEPLNEPRESNGQPMKQNSKTDANITKTDSKNAEDNSKHGNISYPEQKQILMDKSEDEVTDTPALQTAECIDDNENSIRHTESEGNEVDKYNKPKNEQRDKRDEENVMSDANQNNELQVTTQSREYDNENYYEDLNQAQNYEAGYTGLNDEYNYEHNVPYEGNQDPNYHMGLPYEDNQGQNYDQDGVYEGNPDQSYDENVAYEAIQDPNYVQNMVYETNPDQGFDGYINQEYVQGSTEHYDEYVGEQYNSENQYEDDPNTQYQEDSNQQYAYTYDEQYGLNQASTTPVNQLTVSDVYEPNKTEDIHKQQKPNNECIEKEQSSGCPEVEGTKITTIENKNEEIPPQNEPKKKKDVIKSLLDSDTDSTIERNVSNTESDFDFN